MTAIESQGIVFEFNSATVGEITGFTGPGGSASVIDVTSLSSTFKEKMMGLPDEGQFSVELNLDPADLGQIALKTAREARSAETCKVYLTDTSGTILQFEAYCLQFQVSGATDDKVSASATLEIDGQVHYSPRLTVETAFADGGAGVATISLEVAEDTFDAVNSEINGNWSLAVGSSGLTLTSVAEAGGVATITLGTGGKVPGTYTLTFQALAAALTGAYDSGILSVDVTLVAD